MAICQQRLQQYLTCLTVRSCYHANHIHTNNFDQQENKNFKQELSIIIWLKKYHYRDKKAQELFQVPSLGLIQLLVFSLCV